MSSFTRKLVAYFVLLALLPVAAAFWGFDSLAHRSENRRADARLEAGLRAALGSYGDQLQTAQDTAERLARNRDFQAALRRGDGAELERLARAATSLPVRVERSPAPTATQAESAARSVDVVSRGRLLGRVVVTVPLDLSLLRHARSRSGLDPTDLLVAVRSNRILLGPAALVDSALTVQAGRTTVVKLAGRRYRALRTATLAEPPGVSFVALVSQARVDAAAAAVQRRLVVALLALVVVIALVAYLLSRSVVRTLGRFADAAHGIARGRLGERVPVRGRDEFAQLGLAFNEMAAQLETRVHELEAERVRLRESTSRFGEALAATHDVDQLLNVVVHTAAEATGANGGIVLGPRGELARAGDPEAGTQRISLPLVAGNESFGLLVLSGRQFDDEQRETAAMLAAQAVVALENARLHRAVERQASLDGLTGLANRRSAQAALHAEVSRAGRFGTEVAVVMADLDGFKAINDRFGHPVGDSVLREFADTLRETAREVDVVGRWGGEEFVLVLPATDTEGGARLAERVRRAFERRLVLAPDGTRIPVTASFGVASYPQHGSDETIVGAADAALYSAKRAGKNRVVVAAEPVGNAQ